MIRRTAVEVLRSLEARVARLERKTAGSYDRPDNYDARYTGEAAVDREDRKDREDREETIFWSVVNSLEDFVRRSTRSIEAWAEENDYGDYDGMAGIEMSEKDIKRKISEGWDRKDLVRYYLLAEEIDPRVDEDDALREMAKLVAKNKR